MARQAIEAMRAADLKTVGVCADEWSGKDAPNSMQIRALAWALAQPLAAQDSSALDAFCALVRSIAKETRLGLSGRDDRG